MKVKKVKPITEFDAEGKHFKYVSFEFNTPSTHEVTVWLDEDNKPIGGDEIAYGYWSTFDTSQEVTDYLSYYNIDLKKVLQRAVAA